MTDQADPGILTLLHDAARPANDAPALDPAAAPAEPLALFVDWLRAAVEGGVVQPQALTLATHDPATGPAARTLLLKNVTDEAVWFATSSLSPKGRQITADPRVALTFYWREQGRQVRMHGVATAGPRATSVADFVARHPDSRAVAVALPQSSPIDDPEAADVALAEAKGRIAADDAWAPDDWTAYRVDPTTVEFWQATTGRDQVRLQYSRPALGDPWRRSELWP